MARRCERWPEGGARAGDGATRCARHTELVAKFVSQLLPAVSAEPPLWEGELPRLAAQRSSKLLCAEALVVGTGDLGFRQSTDSTVALGATRRSYCGPTSWNTQVRAFSPRGCHQAVGGRPSVLRS